eukprot:ANDGO_03105.mRNA.1 hypothetical protein
MVQSMEMFCHHGVRCLRQSVQRYRVLLLLLLVTGFLLSALVCDTRGALVDLSQTSRYNKSMTSIQYRFLPEFNATWQVINLVAPVPGVGANVFYHPPVNVTNGFEVTFRFKISDAPEVCQVADLPPIQSHQQNHMCRRTGGDGFALVFQTSHEPRIVGTVPATPGHHIGYGNWSWSSVAIEFDTHYNGEVSDAFDSHVAVQTSLGYSVISANHTAGTVGMHPVVATMKDGLWHQASVAYVPYYHQKLPIQQRYVSTTKAFSSLLESSDSSTFFEPAFLVVYIDNMLVPEMVVPFDFRGAINLVNDNQAWMGITGSNGERMHRVQITDWNLCERDPLSTDRPWRGHYCTP